MKVFSISHYVALLVFLAACTVVNPVQNKGTQTPGLLSADLFEAANEQVGTEGYPAVFAIGGGAGYGDWVEKDKAKVVSTKDELLDKLAKARAGDVIYVEDKASIDLTGVWDLKIPEGVTLASGRGRNGSLGALLYTTSNENRILISIRESGVRITGLRLRGPSTVELPGGCPKNARGILIRGTLSETVTPTVEIDNNDLWGWPNSAIQIAVIPGVYLHHNYIHHNRRRVPSLTVDDVHGCVEETGDGYALGYGINISATHVLIDANRFDYNRHDIASSGAPGSGYTASFNLVGNHGTSHSFDMHGFGEQFDAELPYNAGALILIHNNIFLMQHYPAIKIRGTPIIGAWIYRNYFAGPEKTIVQNNIDTTEECVYYPDTVNLHVENNQFGPDYDVHDGC